MPKRYPSVAAATAALILAWPASTLAQTYEYSAQYQPNLQQIGVTPSLHDRVSGAGVGIAILDTLADYRHLDLTDHISVYTPYAGTYSTFPFHGTHVSGIAGASANGLGIVGVAPDAWLYNYAVFQDGSKWVANDLGKAALNHIVSLNQGGANIKTVNMSYGPSSRGDVFLNGELNLFDDYKNAFVIVRAAGNSGANAVNEYYTGVASSSLSHLLIVGSVDSNNQISSFSNKPGSACIAKTSRCANSEKMMQFFIVAPGRSVLSDYPDQQLAYATGTSMAAPHVAGAVALVAEDGLSRNTPLTPTDIASILKRSATDLGKAGVDAVYGWGLLNVPAALAPIGTTVVATGSTVDDGGTALRTSSLRLSRSSSRALGDPALLAGIVVFDEFGRPYEAEIDRSSTATGDYLAGRSDALAAATALKEALRLTEPGWSLVAWTSGDAGPQAASAFSFASEGLDLHAAVGGPGLFFQAQPGDGTGPEPPRVDQLMFATLGETAHLFDRSASASTRIRLGADWDLSSFVVGRINEASFAGAAETYDAVAALEDGSATLAGVGLNYKLSGNWSAGVSYGLLHEQGSLAGSEAEGAFALGEGAVTQTVGISFTGKLSETLALGGFYGRSFIDGYGDADSVFATPDGWSGDQFGLTLTASDVIEKNSALRLSLVKPLQITEGTLSARVPVGRELDGTVLYEDRSTGFDDSALPANLTLEYISTGDGMTKGLAFDLLDSDVTAAGDLDLAISARFSVPF